MAALHFINLYERNDIERQRLPRIFHRHLPWEDFLDEELIKRYWFGRESLLFIARLFIASGSFLQVIGDTHGYDKATVSRIVRRITLALANKHQTWVKFPSTIEEKNAIYARECMKLRVFPA